MPAADFEAVCAQLSTAELGAVAQSEGIVWGQVKGYPVWPAQVMAPDRAAKDEDLRKAKPAKGSNTAVQFFGDASKAWIPDKLVLAWSEGCSKGYLKGKKTLTQAIMEVHSFLQTGTLPDGWWQRPPKVSPVKRASAAAETAAAPRQQHKAAAKKGKPAEAKAAAAGDAGQQQKKRKPSKAEAPGDGRRQAAADVDMQDAEAEPDAASPATEAAALAAAGGMPLAAAALAAVAAGTPVEAAGNAAVAAAAAARAAGGVIPLPGTLGTLALPALTPGLAPVAAAGGGASPRPAGTGSTSTRDMLRSVFNRIKLLHPGAARLETPNSVVDLLAALRKHFGPAMAMATEQLRGKDANDLLASLFSWAAGRPIGTAEVDRCFPLVPHGKVLMPYALWDKIAELGLYPLHWQLPLTREQVEQGQRDGAAGVPPPHAAPACRVAAPGTVAAVASSAVVKKKRVAPAGEPKSYSEPRPARAAPRQQMPDLDGDYEPAPRAGRRHSALAPPSRFALESGASTGSGLLGPASGSGQDRAASPSLTAEEAASSQRAQVAGRGPGLPVVDGRIVRPRAGSSWPGPNPEGFEGREVPALEGRNSLPAYLHVRQNVWVSRPRPKRLLRDDIPVCNCHAPVGPSISSRRFALEQQQAQRQQAQLAQWQQQAAAQQAAEQQRLVLPPPPLPALVAAGAIPAAPAPAAQLAFQPAPQPEAADVDGAAAAADDGGAGRSPDGGSAKKRVRRTDWEGRKCDWCGVTETSNWRRHPDNRDMLLCNQCGGYVRKHGKLSQERRDRVAAQQVAVAMASAGGHAPQPLVAGSGNGLAGSGGSALGLGNGGVLPLFQAAPVTMPPPPPMPLPELAPPAMPAPQEQQEQAQAVAAAMAAVANLASGLRDSASPPSHPGLQQQPASMEVDGSAAEDGGEPAKEADPKPEGMELDGAEAAAAQQPEEPTASLGPEDAAAAAALVAALFAPWREELAALREERQAVAELVAAAFAPWLPQRHAAVEVKQEAMPAATAAPALPLPVAAEVKQQPMEGLPLETQQLLAMQAPAGAQRRSSAAALGAAAAPPPPTRTGSGSLRRAAAAASAAAAAPQVGCGDSCLNRLSFIHCDRSTCPCGDRCTNRPFVELASPAMEVYLTPDKGWGVRAMAFIPRGTFIVEYAGEVIDDKECSRRAEDAKARNEPHFYMMEMAPGLIIDARSKGNLARLLNSSCDPNCETQKWHDAGNSEVRVGIFSLRDVLPGEELTYDYQFQHFGLAAAAGAYRCKCGAPNCRGTMDTQPERTRDFGRRVDVWWPAERRYYRGTVTAYSSAQQRHTVKYDDGDVGRVYLRAEKYRWVDDHGHVVGDTHEPEAGAVAAGRGGAAGKTRGGGGSEGSAANGGGKRQKRSTMDLLGGGGGGGTGSSASDLQSLPSGGAAEAAAPLQGTAAALGASLAAGHASAVDDAVPMDGVSAEPAAAGLPLGSPGQQFGGAAAAPGGLLSAQGASPGKVLDTYTHFNLAAQQPGAAGLGSAAAWLPPPVVAPPPNLDIQGLRVSLLPPPAQAAQLPETLPLDTTSPLAAAGVAAHPFNDFRHLDGLTPKAQQVISQIGQVMLGSPKAMAVGAQLHPNGNGSLVKQEGEQQQQEAPLAAAAVAAFLQPVAHAAPPNAGAEVRQLRDPSLQPMSGTIGHRRGRGGGQPGLADAEPARPRRTVRRPARRFDDDYEGQEVDSDEDYVPSEHEEPASPPRVSASSRARSAVAATLSPATQAAVTMATLLGGGGQNGLPPVLPAVVGRPQVKKEESGGGDDDAADPDVTPEGLSTRATQRRQPQAPLPVHVPATAPAAAAGAARGGGGNRRNAPTPASTGLPARTILVAKRLTNSDVSKGRILLPRAAVEANLSFAIGKAHSLIARDHQQQTWEFTLQSWANGSRAGMESRRVYVLEHAGDFVRAHALKPDDVIGLSSSDEGAFLVEYNTEEVLAASENLAGARFGHPAPMPAAGSVRPAANMLIQQNAGRCMRSEHCTKPAGHPGFCVRTHAAAAAAAARKARQANAAAAAAAAGSPPEPASALPAVEASSNNANASVAAAAALTGTARAGAPRVLGGGGGHMSSSAADRDLSGAKRMPELFEGDHGADGRPKRARRPTEKATVADDDSDDDYLAAAAATADAIAEAAADTDAGMSSDDDAPLMHPTFFQLKAKPPAASAGGLPLPPAAPMPGPNGLPIFVMAPDPAAAAAAAAPPQLRSPLRPSLSMNLSGSMPHLSGLHHSSATLHQSHSLPLHLGGHHNHHHTHHHHHLHHHSHNHHHSHLPQHASAPPPSHPPASLPLASGLGAPVMPPSSLPQALPLSMPGAPPTASAPLPIPSAGPAPGGQPGQQPGQQQQHQAHAAHDVVDYLAASPPDDGKQQAQAAQQQPPRPSPPPGQQPGPRPPLGQQQQQQQQQQPRPPAPPGQQQPRPGPPQGQQQQHPRPPPGAQQQPMRPGMLPLRPPPGMQLPPRPLLGAQQPPPRPMPGAQQPPRPPPGMQQLPPRPGGQQQAPRPLPGGQQLPPRPGPQQLGPRPMPGGQQSLRPLPLPLSQPGQAPRPAGAPPRPGGAPPRPGGGGPPRPSAGPPRPMMPRPMPSGAAPGQGLPPPPGLLGATSYLPPRPGSAPAPPPLFGGAPPAVAPGVGLPAHLPAHHHHHPPHMPPPPPQPEFDVSAFLSSAD